MNRLDDTPPPFVPSEMFGFAMQLCGGERCLLGNEWVVEVGYGPKFERTLSFNSVVIMRTV